ncbi:rho-related GTP-binding protein Rho6-like protein [Willisornis vidua]|uniref:Rho-related GTP-binding protein Rho6-like protein n=1 Tax=Willisornis vidua TaxID=1566151 RepID=A0ABQ9E178_9PASS|nr:rho-related GTP-binding protein Rho6-like protein [Willisornis vidua]
MRERRPVPAAPARCKLVLVGDVQCGKTAMLQVLAKDCYPETYVPTVFENYTACLASEEQRVELSLWDTSGTEGCMDGRLEGAPVPGGQPRPRSRWG